MKNVRDFSTGFILILFVARTLVVSAPIGEVYDDVDDVGGRGATGYKRSPVHTIVVNLNASSTDDLFKNFNVSKDDVFRRLAQRNDAELPPATTDTNNGTESTRRNDDERYVLHSISYHILFRQSKKKKKTLCVIRSGFHQIFKYNFNQFEN